MPKSLNYYLNYFLNFELTLKEFTKIWEAESTKFTPIPPNHEHRDEVLQYGIDWLNSSKIKFHHSQHIKNMMSEVIQNKILQLIENEKTLQKYIVDIRAYIDDPKQDPYFFLEQCEAYESYCQQMACKPEDVFLKANTELNKQHSCFAGVKHLFCHPHDSASHVIENRYHPPVIHIPH